MSLEIKPYLSENFEGKLTHVTKKDSVMSMITEGFKDDFYKKEFRDNHKPHGAWLSVNDGWEKWCVGEMPNWFDNHFILSAKLKSNLKLLLLDSEADFYNWMNEFGKDHYIKNDYGFDSNKYNIGFTTSNPEIWNWTSKHFDGIYLTDKGQAETRYGTFLYGWDCASMCIFDFKSVEFSSPIKVEECYE